MQSQSNSHLESKKWLLAFILTIIVFLQYARPFTDGLHATIPSIQFVLYLTFFISAILFGFQKTEISIKPYWYSLFIVAMPLFNLLLVFLFPEGHHENKLKISFETLQFFLMTLIIVVTLSRATLIAILKRFTFIVFIIALGLQAATSMHILSPNELLNSNTIGFMLAPYLIFLFMARSTFAYRIPVYIIGTVLIYITGATTTLVGFILLPIFMVLLNLVKHPRLMFTVLLLGGFLVITIPILYPSPIFESFFTHRDILWSVYFQNTTETLQTFLLGTGEWKVENIGVESLEGLKAHNTYLSLLHLNGLIGLLLYLLYITFGVRKKHTSFNMIDGLLFLSLTFQIAESNTPVLSFTYSSFIFSFCSLMNEKCER
ncbi:hypothetical protein QU593_02290 [Rossellomorea marisflavi]|uniref:hypothetical protein n=1 Tax=Rossellomorea marisflavi TaxID=189381 RepID=UPI0025B1BFAA|nr:hypothetical protein [Rossellomorea marisflavi]WJV19360.1 hypothetical protein QU593_02290 [Rossellomorea marisflavi]